MTIDEFERILVAAKEMRIMYLSGEAMVSLRGIIEIVESQLHPEDRGKWKWFDDSGRCGWDSQQT